MNANKVAALTGLSIRALHHYDALGLLSPARGENGYRFYSIKQLAICNTIRILHQLHVPLVEIKQLLEQRTPKLAEDVLVNQIGDFGEKQSHLAQAQALLHTTLRSIRSGMSAEEGEIKIENMPAERIMMGDVNDYSDGRTDYDALYTFYETMSERYSLSEYDICFPVWGMISEERIKTGNWGYPERFYFFNPNGNDQRPGATYAVSHTRSGYGGGRDVFSRMLSYIEQNGYEVCGNAYEEYPLNEVGVLDESDYLMRIMIMVRKRNM